VGEGFAKKYARPILYSNENTEFLDSARFTRHGPLAISFIFMKKIGLLTPRIG